MDPRIDEWKRQEHCWSIDRVHNDRPVHLSIPGSPQPDPALIRAVLAAFDRLDSLQAQIDRRFAELMSRPRRPMNEHRLLIEELFFAKPNHGAAFLAGGCDGRCWHCDIIDLRVQSLCFDD